MKKYRVDLTVVEREELLRLSRSGKTRGRKLTRARILLKADQGDDGPAWPDTAVAEALDVRQDVAERP